MLKEVISLGKAISNDINIEDYLQEIPHTKEKTKFIAKVHLKSNGEFKLEIIDYDQSELREKEIQKEWVWIGNAPGGANQPQWIMTSRYLHYLLSQSWNILPKCLEQTSPLYEKIMNFYQQWRFDFGETLKDRERWMLDLHKLGFFNEKEWEEIISKENAKEAAETAEKKILKNNGIKDGEICLFTVVLDEQYIVGDEDYRNVVIKQIIDVPFQNKSGICSACGKEKEVTEQLTRMKFKYYITDKISFANNTINFENNLMLCKECYWATLIGETYIQKNMSTSIAGKKVYYIPSIIGNEKMNLEDLERLNKTISKQFRFLSNMESHKNYENEMDNLNVSVGYMTDIIFFEQNKSEFKILKSFKSVPSTRYEELMTYFVEANQIGEEWFGKRNTTKNWELGFDQIYQLYPVKKKEYKKVISAFEKLFIGGKHEYYETMKNFQNLLYVYYMEKFSETNIKEPKEWNCEFIDAICFSLIYLYTLLIREELQNHRFKPIEGGKKLEEKIGFHAGQKWIFYLGCLLNSVAVAQSQKGHKEYPVLEKVNFHGMNASSLIRLSNQVVELIHKYEKLNTTRNQEYMYAMYNAFYEAININTNSYLEKYKVSNEEAVFILMSGFANRQKEFSNNKKEEMVENE